MYTVKIQNACRCFLRSGMIEHQTFATADEAKREAEAMIEQMNRDFCKKHEFRLTQTGIVFTIIIMPSR
jgi:hypothetical protein